ncbi:MAG: HPr family phosphocarrier protein [Lachnospiraceae bacterium]|nr:HPr family phosphocarrier protein [Lachnospiraceae bacterium]
MQQVYVKFNSADQVSQFVNQIDRFDVDFDLGSGRRTVDAKSIMGILALDLSQPLQLRYDSEDSRIRERISPFLIEV